MAAGARPGRRAAAARGRAGITGTEDICAHGVAWYSHTLGAALLERLAYDGGTDLVAALAGSISHVAASHRHTCDITNPSSPQATVAMVRFAEGHVDYLVLADTFVALDSLGSGPQVVTDSREVDVRTECSVPLRGLAVGTLDYERALPSVIDELRARRNQPGGCWIAKDDPDAARHAVTGKEALETLNGVAVLSNGAARAVDPYRLLEWPGVLELLRTSGPDALLRRVRVMESEDGAPGSLPGSPASDDATAAYCDLS